ncbi:MAG TPA: Gfo/Idh/MocA family oxidoreductase [Lactobacillaceae bacterium]|jgi:predicted dehydrogenase
MLKLGVVGTNWISEKFITAAKLTNEYQLVSVYSRRVETGMAFLKIVKESADVFDDWSQFLVSDIDVVYLASPNAWHFSQMMDALQAGKHVLVEKPAVLSVAQVDAVHQFLTEHPDQYVLEAAKHTYLPAFGKVKGLIGEIGPVIGAQLTYMDNASAQLNSDKLPTLWRLSAGRGVLYDLGIYVIYDVILWFGVPETVSYRAQKLAQPGGADYFGVGELQYRDFSVKFTLGNLNDSQATSEIYGKNGTIIIDHPTHFERVTRNGEAIAVTNPENTMAPEVQYFAEMIKQQRHDEMLAKWEVTRQVTAILEALREDAGIEFPAAILCV